MKTNNRIYLTTLIALVIAFTGLLQLLTFNDVSAQKLENSVKANSEMITYALTHEVENLAVRFSIMNQLPCTDLGSEEVGGKTLSAGVYCVNNGSLTKDLTLDGENDSSAIFIFRVKGALKTVEGAAINLENGARSANIYFVADSVEIEAGSQFKGNVLAFREINVARDASIKGQMRSVNGLVNIPAEVENAPAAPGILEICKAAAQGSGAPAPSGLGGRVFTFTITAANGTVQTVDISVGSCSGPISVEQGAATITEAPAGGTSASGGFQLVAVDLLRRNSSSTLGTVNLAARTANINVGPGDDANKLSLQFVNRTAITGFIEICKEAALNGTTPDPDVSGIFTFNIEGVFTTNPTTGARTLTNFFLVPGQCTGALPVTIPTAGFIPTGDVRVSELGRADGSVYLESVSALNGREVGQEILGFRVNENGNVVPNAGGGFSTVRIVAGGVEQEALVTFTNRSTPGNVKICKVAGPGIPIGTPFTFTISGTATTGTGTAADPFGQAPVTRTVIVPADLATPTNPFGNCLFVGTAESPADSGTSNGPFQNFVIGTPVTINEVSPTTITTNNSTNGFRPGEIRTASISVSQGPVSSGLVPNANRISTATFNARREVVIATFTNYTFRPASLKICKIGTGTALGQAFNFSITQNNPILPAQTATVTGLIAGIDNANGGNCQVVGGSATPTVFNANASYTVQETSTNGTLTSVRCPTCAGAPPTTQNVVFTPIAPIATSRAATLGVTGSANQGSQGLRTDVTINQVVFTNAGGTVGTRAAAFDFDGDGKADLSTYSASNGTWNVLKSGGGQSTVQFGQAGDRIVPQDYDGDGKYDIAVYRAGTWFIQQSRDGFKAIQFGEVGDIPQPADFDGDLRADIAVFRPSNGIWYILGSTAGFSGVQFGSSSDKPVGGDYDGDGKADIAVFRPSNGVWYLLRSSGGFTGVQFGSSSDRVVPADYDGDGKTDIGVYRDGTWYLQRSTAGFTSIQFGNPTDRPVAADYDGDGKANIGVYRNGTWFIYDVGTFQLGSADDIPLSLVPYYF